MDDHTILNLFHPIDLLTDHNWPLWRSRFEDTLKRVNLWHLIQYEPSLNDGLGSSTSEIHNENFLDQKVQTLIGLWVSDKLVSIIWKKRSAYQMWNALISYFVNRRPCTPLDDDLTESNMTTNYHGHHHRLASIDYSCKYLSRAQFIASDHNVAVIYTGDRVFYVEFKKSKKIFKIKQLKNLKITQIYVEEERYLALTEKGKLFGWGKLHYDLLSFIGSEKLRKTHLPFPIAHDVEKFSCGDKHTLILHKDGVLKAFGCNQNGQLTYGARKTVCKLLQVQSQLPYIMFSIDYLKDFGIKDIACTSQGSLALVHDNRVFIWGRFGLFYSKRPIGMEICNDPIQSVIGGHNTFMVVNEKGHAYWCHTEDKKFLRQLILVEEAIDKCYYGNSDQNIEGCFVLVGISGWCYVWDVKKSQLFRSVNRSIPDTIVIYTESFASPKYHWIKFHPEFEKKSEQLVPEFALTTYNYHFWSILKMGAGLDREKTSKLLPFYYMEWYYNEMKKTPINHRIISDAYKLLKDRPICQFLTRSQSKKPQRKKNKSVCVQ